MTWLQLANKTAIVTGAGSGLGAAVAKALAGEQCRVVLADRNLQAVQDVAQEFMGNSSAETACVECDVTNMEHVKALIRHADEFASESEGKEKMASLLINCAGITQDNWISKMSEEAWDRVIDVNLKGSFRTCRAFLDEERMGNVISPPPAMSIVNVGSIVSEAGNMGQANYAASKGGVLGMTRALAKEMGRRNVRVNAIVPGFIETPMAHAVPDHVKDLIRPKITLGRFGEPEEFASLASFLLSPRSSYITGESIQVSGMISL